MTVLTFSHPGLIPAVQRPVDHEGMFQIEPESPALDKLPERH